MSISNPFTFLTGFEYRPSGNQFVGQCPFCEKDEKFWFNKDFLWDCKNANCDPGSGKARTGNAITFVRQLLEMFDTGTKGAERLGELFGIPSYKLQALGVKFNPFTQEVLIPTMKEGKISGLYKVVSIDGKARVLCCTGLDHALFHYPEFCHDTIVITEGHKDRCTAEYIFEGKNVTIIGVPGANVWKPEWTNLLAGHDVVFMYDNDAAGRQGMERVIAKHIATNSLKPKSVKHVIWPSNTPEKYDITDAYLDFGKSCYDKLESMVGDYQTPPETIIVQQSQESVQPDRSVETFGMLLDHYKKHFHVTKDFELALVCALASIYSVKLEGEQLWWRFIGQAGSGKTTIARTVTASIHTLLRSTFTGIFSGFVSDHDVSLAKMLAGKAMFIKEADALLSQGDIGRIMSELRDWYDKLSVVQYRTGQIFNYENSRSSIILCGTRALRGADNTALGERFLDCELHLTAKDEFYIKKKMLERSIELANNPNALPPEMSVQPAAKGFIDCHLMEKPMNYSLSESTQEEILDLATLVAKMRAKVTRDFHGKGEIQHKPKAETPSRLIGQMVKLCLCSSVVWGNQNREAELLRKVSRDIIDPDSFRFRIASDLIEKDGMSAGEVEESAKLPKAVVERTLEDLYELGMLDTEMRPVPGKHKTVRAYFKLKSDLKNSIIRLNEHL